MRRAILLVAVPPLLAGSVLAWRYGRPVWAPVYSRVRGRRTVEEVVEEYGAAAEERMRPHWQRAGVPYPPKAVALLAFKKERRVEVWAGSDGAWRLVRAYPVLGASGELGPKLREGDRQVPEGFYRIEGLNPNSSYHLSMKLDYPNAFDRVRAAEEGRTDPGSDIFIHGKTASIGCLAMGDEAIEELFVLIARVGVANCRVIIAPNDLRRGPPATDMVTQPAWLAGLYGQLARELASFASEP